MRFPLRRVVSSSRPIKTRVTRHHDFDVDTPGFDGLALDLETSNFGDLTSGYQRQRKSFVTIIETASSRSNQSPSPSMPRHNRRRCKIYLPTFSKMNSITRKLP
jgi:hypothetical protein